MKKIWILLIITLLFATACGKTKHDVKYQMTKPATKTLTAVYDESNTTKSIFLGDTLDTYTANFELTYNDGSKSSTIPVTKDMISLDTSSVGEKVAKISYNGISTNVSVFVCTPIKDFDVDVAGNAINKYTGTDSSVVVVPRYISGKEINSLKYSAFKNSVSLKSVYLPYITSIGEEAFSACTSLTSVSLPKVTSIGEGAFTQCTSLTSVSLPEGTSIGHGAFFKCTNLTSAYLPNVITIDHVAFSECPSLTSVTFGSITPPTIGVSVFAKGGADKTWTINVPKGTESAYISKFSSMTNTFFETKLPTYNEY